ncbi:MAG: hypothetical protein V5A49_08070 [Haloarcula sp.]
MTERLRSAIENSALKSLADEFTRSLEHSMLSRSGSRLLEISKSSGIYRWLTAEPEPEVIVIDLRETYTLGPFLAVLDALTPQVVRLWRHSVLASVVRAIEGTLSGSATARLAARLLEPPDPPEDSERRE